MKLKTENYTYAHKHIPCVDFIASLFVITALQEVDGITWVPCGGVPSE